MFLFVVWLKGAGGPGSEVDFHFFVDSDRGECQLSETFFGMKKILFQAKVIANYEISKLQNKISERAVF